LGQLSVTDPELLAIINRLNLLAQEGNKAIQEKNMAGLKGVLAAYKACFR